MPHFETIRWDLDLDRDRDRDLDRDRGVGRVVLDRSDVLNAMDARGHDVVAPAFERFAAGDRECLARVTGWPVDGVVLTLPAGVDDRMGRLALAVLDGS